MTRRRLRSGTGRRERLWPVLLALALTVIVPTACILWFMTKAMENERLAVREQLATVYRSQLESIRARLVAVWEDRTRQLAEPDAGAPPPERFAAIVRAGTADSALVFSRDGALLYPVRNLDGPGASPSGPDWEDAARREFAGSEPGFAADAYLAIARRAADESVAGQALRAAARCQLRAGDVPAALAILTGDLAAERFRTARDGDGRLLRPEALLRALELTRAAGSRAPGDQGDAVARRLAEQAADYTLPLPSSQRLFLLRRLEELAPGVMPASLLAAEALVAAHVDAIGAGAAVRGPHPEGSPDAEPSLHPSALPRTWYLDVAAGSVTALYRQERIAAEAADCAAQLFMPANVTLSVAPPGTALEPGLAFVTLPLAAPLAGWQLALGVVDGALLETAAERQAAAYRWTAALVVASITLLALATARLVSRQMRVARLKNDLVATVSHELKTPLSSIRLLVDTLLEGGPADERRTREYLELIARENARLSRLIDNFLAFSRLERNKRAFEFARVDPAALARAAADAVRERFEAAGFELDLELPAGLPEIVADADAMVTVLINLLDNAFKYSEADRRVRLCASAGAGEVRFAVTDRGIGMSRRVSKRIFDRFYQADRSLARRAGGCGLGLSIVKFIVEAHSGSAAVSSEPGRGTTMTVRLPAAAALPAGARPGTEAA